MPQAILPIFPKDATAINGLLSFAKRDEEVLYFMGSMPISYHDEKDLRTFGSTVSQFVVNGNCRQVDIVRAFGVSAISVKRYVKKYRKGGAAAFYTTPKKAQPRVLTPAVLTQVQHKLNEGSSRREVATAFGIKLNTLSKAIAAGRLRETESTPACGVSKSERSIADSQAGMGMGCTRELERVAAAVGKLLQAPSQFKTLVDIPNGGVLWALPALLMNGLLHHTRDYFHLPKGFYSLTQIILLLAYLALARLRAHEELRYTQVGEWGKLLGLDRIPEVRTLRKKLKYLTTHGNVSGWSASLSQEWLKEDPKAAGVLYVDGHIRPYYGHQTKLPRRYVSRQRLCLRGLTDYWVNDQLGRPFFVISTPLNQGLLQMLREEIVPRLLKEVPGQPSPAALEGDPQLSRFTLIFDREGYSPNFFREMWEQRIACQTYHKFPDADWPPHEFRQHTLTMPVGTEVTMSLAERSPHMTNGMVVREIRKLKGTGPQISVLSTDFKVPPEVVGVHMFSRWSQENFFRYMMEEFGIDGLTSYQLELIDETAKVVNPAYRKLEGQIKKVAGKLGHKRAIFGANSLRGEFSTSAIARYQSQQADLKEELDFLGTELTQLKHQRTQTVKHITLAELPEADRFVQLAPTRKQFMNVIKMIAYRAETAMALRLKGFLARPDDARSLLQEVFTTEADLIPNYKEKTLTVCLHHLSNRLSDDAVRGLTKTLNESDICYPDTDLRMLYKLVSDPNP